MTFLTTLIVVVASVRAGAGVERDCTPSWILCGGEWVSLDLDQAYWSDGAYLESGQGTGRLALVCALEDVEHCFLFGLERRDHEWWVVSQISTPRGRHLYMSGDGNLGVYDESWNAVWESGTFVDETDAYLNVFDSGCAGVWHEDDSGMIWHSCG